MNVFWSGKAALKSTSKTGLPAKSQFETYRAISTWKMNLTKATGKPNAVEKIEENAFNFLWESFVQYVRPTDEAMAALKAKQVPRVPVGSW